MSDEIIKKRYVKADIDNLPVFQALASETRLNIIELLRNKELSISEIAEALDLSSAAITKNISILEEAEIVESYSKAGNRGLMKLSRLKPSELQVIINNNYEETLLDVMEIDIPIGSYTSFDVKPPCGLASKDKLIGILDDSRYFVAPERSQSSIIWFTYGYLEYAIPIYEIDFPRLDELEISMEICSEYPGYNNHHKSDIYFTLNGIDLGTWTSPGDFGDRKGRLTPKWWNLGSEYGLLKTIKINENGVFLEGIQLSNVPLSEFVKNIETQFLFRIGTSEDAEHPGGMNLFGKNFGNFEQDIKIKCLYTDK